MNLVAAAATAVAVALCAACAVVAVPVPGRRRDAPEEDHHHHHHHNNNNNNNDNKNNNTTSSADLEVALVKFLDVYYDRYVKPLPAPTSPPPPPEEDIYEQMQSDQPVTHNPEFLMGNGSDYATMKRGRDKLNWIETLKEKILRGVGRENASNTRIEQYNLSSINISGIIPQFLNGTVPDEDQIAEKIRSYYPACELPRNTDQDLWKDENAMNLYFSFDHAPEDNNGVNVASATLRLYRLPNATNPISSTDPECENPEDDRLLRVSIYWYTRTLRKHKGNKIVKRRLCDSKVVGEHAKWVELSVKPAIRAWSKGRNSGLAVVVEDQDGTILRADRYFKGASCTVGASTPKPIPTIIVDAARQANKLDRANGLPGRNSTTALHSDIPLPPTIDICTLEFPENYTQPSHISSLRVTACNLRKLYEDGQKLAEREKLERIATISSLLEPHNTRHIRHQRQHLERNGDSQNQVDFDPRSRMVGQQVVLTNQELQSWNVSTTTNR